MYKSIITFCLLLLPFSNAFSQSGYRVKTLTGDTAGYMNGATSIALFNSPTAIVNDTAGNLYVADTYNNVIRKIWSTDSVTTLAGNDTAGYRNGNSSTSEFNSPLGICMDRNGNVYIADTYNHVIRKITPSGTVSTLAGTGTAGLVNGPADSAEFYLPTGVAADTSGNIFVADNGNYCIREISTTGMVSTVAGTGYAGFKNGASDTSMFNGLFGIMVNDSGTIYVTEYLNNDVRRISNGMVSVLAGYRYTPTPEGFRDGSSDTALFNNPTGITADNSGNIYVSDEYNNRIRKIGNGTVSTLAGNGTAGWVDSLDYESEFNNPYGITMYKGNFYVADNGNNKIREISPMVLGIAPVHMHILSVLAYPNPCTTNLIIASAPAGDASLLDITGREVWNNSHFKAPYVISTGSLPAGMYFLQIVSPSGIATHKIIVQH